MKKSKLIKFLTYIYIYIYMHTVRLQRSGCGRFRTACPAECGCG